MNTQDVVIFIISERITLKLTDIGKKEVLAFRKINENGKRVEHLH